LTVGIGVDTDKSVQTRVSGIRKKGLQLTSRSKIILQGGHRRSNQRRRREAQLTRREVA